MLLFPPIPMRARTFVIAYGLLELFLGVTGTAPGVAHFAHLGGMAFGFLLISTGAGAGRFAGSGNEVTGFTNRSRVIVASTRSA